MSLEIDGDLGTQQWPVARRFKHSLPASSAAKRYSETIHCIKMMHFLSCGYVFARNPQ